MSFPPGVCWGEAGYKGLKRSDGFASSCSIVFRPPPPLRIAPVAGSPVRVDTWALGSFRSGWKVEIGPSGTSVHFSRAEPGTSQSARPQAGTRRHGFPIFRAGLPRSNHRGAGPAQDRFPVSGSPGSWRQNKPWAPPPAGPTRHVRHATDGPPRR